MVVVWYAYQFIRKKFPKSRTIGLYWAPVVIFYFFCGVFPILIISNYLVGINAGDAFLPLYIRVIESTRFEVVTTTLITSLYLIQLVINQKLQYHLDHLEQIVEDRTAELEATIEQLHDTNNELTTINEHLDSIVFERTKVLENKNAQLTEYAFINSHLLRAPVARVLGLANILKLESTKLDSKELIDRFIHACNELDSVVKIINEVLSENTDLTKDQLKELQDKIKKISTDLEQR
jgi:signal transduction histidine kinase